MTDSTSLLMFVHYIIYYPILTSTHTCALESEMINNQEQRTELKLSINILMKKRFYIIYVRQRDNFIQRLIDERCVDNCESQLSSNIRRR